ncbi:MAG: hypothetical protein Q4E22_01540, partial [Coriobacteriia bacterium]|nr:hypothetical protein [Coriobacteriia bacterium]
MKKFLAASVATAMLAGSLGAFALPADAQAKSYTNAFDDMLDARVVKVFEYDKVATPNADNFDAVLKARNVRKAVPVRYYESYTDLFD